jgi:hypothetical protein
MDTSRSEILEKIKQRLTRSGISITKVIPAVISEPRSVPTTQGFNLEELFNRDPFDNPPFFTDVDKIKKMLSLDYRTEVELSIGSYHENGSFDPNVFSRISFDNVRKALSAIKSMSVIVNDDVVEIASSDEGTIRRLTDQEGSTFQRKKRSKDTVENDVWGYRISSSTETFIEEPKNFKPTLTRKRHRYTFIETSSSGDLYGVRFDLSVIEEIRGTHTNHKHEIEIERESTIAKDKKLSIRTFEKAYKFVLMALQNVNEENLLMTLQERQYAVLAHNSLINPPVKETYNKMSLKDLRHLAQEAQLDIRGDRDMLIKRLTPLEKHGNPYRLIKGYWNKPTNLHLDDLLNPSVNFSVTLKVDGVRRFLLITKAGMYLCGPPYDIHKISASASDYIGSLIDCEFYEESTIYAFDLLFYKFSDYRLFDFFARYKTLTNMGVLGSSYIIKKYFMGDSSVYNKTKEAFDIIDNDTSTSYDGLIFQSQKGWAKKWKPVNLMSIDFLLGPTKDESIFNLLVINPARKSHIQFRNMTIEIEKGIFNGQSVSNRIMECIYDKTNKTFIPIRFRDDRDAPNKIDVANDVWKDIISPISRDTIEGNSLQVMRRYHNIEKLSLLKSNFRSGDIILDWGSGRGGDLSKWDEVGLKKVFAVEPNDDNFSELEKRMKSMNIKTDVIPVRNKAGELVGAEAVQSTKNTLSKHLKKGESLSGITAFFSLTFMADNKETYKNMLNAIDSNLPEGGKLVGIVMDGRRTRSLLDERKLETGNKLEVYKRVSFEIKEMSEITDNTTGNTIEIDITDSSSMVKEQTEWLFYFQPFRTALEAKNITLTKTGFLDRGDVFNVLNDDGKIFSSLNRFFVFERKKTIIKQVKEYVTDKIYNIENGLIKIGVIKDNSSLLHAILRGYDEAYIDLSNEKRIRKVIRLRKKMAEKLTEDDIPKGVEFETFKTNLADEKELLTAMYIPYISTYLEVNVILYSNSSCDHAYEDYVIVDTPNSIFYNLIGERVEDEINTVFTADDEIIENLCK